MMFSQPDRVTAAKLTGSSARLKGSRKRVPAKVV
jgi:hypothetical protein